MNRAPVALILSGASGQGKSLAAVSFSLPELPQPRRLAVGFEMGLRHYQSEDGKDNPKRLLFAFDHFPVASLEKIADVGDLVDLYRTVRDCPYDVIVLDNIALLQEALCTAADTQDGAAALMKGFDLEAAYRPHLALFGRNVRDQVYWRLIKDVCRKLILAIRSSNKHLVGTTEEKNCWLNYGSRDRANPPKIVGQTAKILMPWLQYSDGILTLSRTLPPGADAKPRLTDVPWAQMDTFSPKNRLVGLPARFEMSWPFLWKCVDERKIPSKEDLAQVITEAAQVVEEEMQVQESSQPEPAVPVCGKCGNVIAGGVDAKGKPFTAEKIVEHTTRTCGQPMCYECYRVSKLNNGTVNGGNGH
jgi:hypothetical protein